MNSSVPEPGRQPDYRISNMPKLHSGYVGRFAPSPTGPLHFGSLLAATASYLQALTNNGLWHLRIDDLDGPRCDPQWNSAIPKTLEAFGFEWHGEVIYQSARMAAYRAAMETLIAKGLVFDCNCSRKQLAKTARRGDSGIIYPGHCRRRTSKRFEPSNDYAQRINVSRQVITFNDGWQGEQQRDLDHEDGDFVIWRRDSLPAYHLAVVVDDAAIGVTESVRGIDLLGSTPKQIFLQRQLRLSTPDYRHVGIAVNKDGDKLSKLTHATALNSNEPALALFQALAALQQQPPDELKKWPTTECWQWAMANWQPEQLVGITNMLAR